MLDPARQARARVRATHALLHKTRLVCRELDLSPLRGADAVSLVCRLTRESWSLAGLEEPNYTRRKTPYRFVPGRLT